MEKPNFFAVLPAFVRYDKGISDAAKLIYAEIAALTNKEGYCWAQNQYFADCFDKDPATISRIISKLSEKGFIKLEFENIEKEGVKRKIYLGGHDINVKGGIDENVKGGIDENVKYNNISNNNSEEPQKNIAPTDLTASRYKPSCYPVGFGKTEIPELREKMLFYLSNIKNIESLCSENMMAELSELSEEEWGILVDKFIEYNFSPNGYQSAFNKDFPAVYKNFKIFLKRQKGSTKSKAKNSLPAYEEIQALAQSAAEKNAAPIAKVIRSIDFNALLESTGATIIALTDQMKVEPITAQEFVQLAIMHKGNKNAIIELLGAVSTAKRETRWLDGYKTLFAAIKAQYDFKNKK